jgi:hypothetical protein
MITDPIAIITTIMMTITIIATTMTSATARLTHRALDALPLPASGKRVEENGGERVSARVAAE